MAKLYIALGAAVVASLFLSMAWKPLPFEERLIAIQMQEAPPELARLVADEPIEVQALLLDYASDEILKLKAQSALLRYPELVRRVLPIYGSDQDFQGILREHGESVFLPIAYFLANEVSSVAVMHYTAQKFQSLRQATGSNSTTSRDNAEQPGTLTPELRGRYAVRFIENEGHGFLGQFVLDSSGNPRWLQSERLLEGAGSFFVGGIGSLERKAKTDQAINIADAGWAGVDVLLMASAVKLLRLGRVGAVAGKPLSSSTRTAALASRVARVGQAGVGLARHGKWPAIILAGYVAIQHPGIINDTFANLARFIGLPGWLGQFAGWLIILLPVFYLGAWIMRWMVAPTIKLLRATLATLSRFEPAKGRNA
ncbi:hypothetical protein [Thiohalomonas denitrificans]|uniref:Uncharacterized protein n=1 Tax=Thiohalomonas denitrificans TaxID=415747 RepID=A0A1G5QS45_9GAMM|nr:hypothetical protein [Thiohalomonas denitrificans]SCZ64655.1 hypothetical protein SAMN03097708_02682 [Thiohalomonas denitrificans]